MGLLISVEVVLGREPGHPQVEGLVARGHMLEAAYAADVVEDGAVDDTNSGVHS